MRILCEVCHERGATVHLSKKIAGQPDGELHLCDVCCPLNGSEKEDQELLGKFFGNMPPHPPDDRSA